MSVFHVIQSQPRDDNLVGVFADLKKKYLLIQGDSMIEPGAYCKTIRVCIILHKKRGHIEPDMFFIVR